jgi:hypothetical protein
MRNRVLVLMAAVLSSAYGLVTAYHVEPVKAAWSGWTHRPPVSGYYVSEVITDNFDELVYCEFFNGKGSNAGIDVQVLTCPGGHLIATGDTNDPGDHKWLRCYLNTSAPDSIVKGKKLEFRFTRSGSDSIQYYYDSNCGYHYGQMIAPYPNPIAPGTGLAMSCYGCMSPLDSTYWWGYRMWLDSDTSAMNAHGISAKAKNAGVGTDHVLLNWPDIWPDSGSACTFGRTNAEVAYAHTTLGCEIIGLLAGTPGWVSSRVDTVWVDSPPPGHYRYDSGSCPPKYLERPAQDDAGNYWYDYVDSVVTHFSSIHVWEIWNEPNDTSTFWKVPKIYYPIDDRAHDMCSLYTRLCVVAEKAIHSVRPDDTVLIGSLVCLPAFLS